MSPATSVAEIIQLFYAALSRGYATVRKSSNISTLTFAVESCRIPCNVHRRNYAKQGYLVLSFAVFL